MATERIDLVIQGSGPYGFRLAGGDGRPLTVTKLRQQSKACEAGLHEGDFLIGINSFECRTMSHSSAMALLENAVDSISLSVFRGSMNELDRVFDAASFRPLSPGSIPPPRLLPPPPAVSSGDLVIDQPSFLRQSWPLQKHAHDATTDVSEPVNHPHHPLPPPPPMMPSHPFPPVAEPKVLDAAPPQPLPLSDTLLPTFRVKPFSGEAKQWAPYGQAPSQPHPVPPPQQQQPSDQQFITRNVPEPNRPHMWQPSETPLLVRSHPEVNLDPEPEPEPVETTTWPTPPAPATTGRLSVRLDHGDSNHVEVIPRWALPLRSDYDWREFYYWADDDDWELTEDGQYAIRKKKKVPTAPLR